MKIKIIKGKDNAHKAVGLTVVIDVFRAFTTTCFIFENGAEKVIPVGDLEEAYELKKENPEYILMGERGGYIQPGFDFGNSPSKILNEDFTGKTIVLTTSSGTQGIVKSVNAKEIITASFVNADAIIEYIKYKKPEVVSLLATVAVENNEDVMCAKYIKESLEGKEPSFIEKAEKIEKAGFTGYFLDPEKTSHPFEDLALCFDLDRFDFVIKVFEEEKGKYLKKI